MATRGSRNCPPSEKESGVTFTIPITSVRSPSSSRRERNCHVNRGRNAMRNSVLAQRCSFVYARELLSRQRPGSDCFVLCRHGRPRPREDSKLESYLTPKKN